MPLQNKRFPIQLSGVQHIAEGKQQWVYEHPYEPEELIKIYKPYRCNEFGNKPYKPDENGIGKIRYRDKFRRATAFRGFQRELHEYLAAKAGNQAPGNLLPISEVRGVVPTDLGLGMVYERISNADGSLARTLLSIVRKGDLKQLHLTALEEFFDSMISNHITVRDLHLSNIVYQEGSGMDGRAVCVDGFAVKQRIPLLFMSKRLNAHNLEKERKKLLEKLFLFLDSDQKNTSPEVEDSETV